MYALELDRIAARLTSEFDFVLNEAGTNEARRWLALGASVNQVVNLIRSDTDAAKFRTMPDAVTDEYANTDAALTTAIRALSEFLTIRKIEGEFRVSVAPLYWTRKGMNPADAWARNDAVAQYISADEHGGREAKFDARCEVYAAAKELARNVIWNR